MNLSVISDICIIVKKIQNPNTLNTFNRSDTVPMETISNTDIRCKFILCKIYFYF